MKSLLKHAVAVAALSVLLSACGKSKQAATDESAAPGAAPAGAERVVNVYNWSDYIDPEVIQGFEQSTGIKVRYDVFDSNEVLETKLLTGNPGYDDVVPFRPRLVETFPDRVLWGPDWPHPNMKTHMPDDGKLVDFVPRIATTPALQQKLLVDNPMRLYWKD